MPITNRNTAGAASDKANGRYRKGGYLRRDPGSWKAVVDILVTDCGGQTAVSTMLGISQSVVNDWTHPYKPRCLPSPDQLARMVGESGSTIVAEYYASLSARCRVVPAEVDNAGLHALAAHATREAAEFTAAYMEAAADGIDTAEMEVLHTEASEAARAWARVEADCLRQLHPLRTINGGK